MYEQQSPRSGAIPMIVLSVFLISAISVAAVFTTGSRFGSTTTNVYGGEPAASLLAKRVMELKITPKISDEDLRQIQEAVMKRAKAGEVEAAAFVFDLAARQRIPEKQAAVSTAGPAGRSSDSSQCDPAPVAGPR